MHRAVMALGGTAAVLAALFSFKAHSLAAAAPSPPATPAAASPAPAKSAAPAATRTITGPVAMTKYGPMQVKVTVVGQRITRVTVVQRTGHGAKSQRIASFVIPKPTS
jgi:uncharacterized protein with FMN-binding domain